MSDEWIKMRTSLRRHPKVVRIASALCTERFRVIGGLFAVWSVFDEHSEDGKLVGYTYETMDAELGWPGFSRAMAEIGWLAEDSQALVMRDHSSHNGQSAKRRAEDASRKRRVRNLSAGNADEMKTRERKEKKKKEKIDEALRALPDWLPQQTWTDFAAHRRQIGSPLTDLAADRLLTRLADFRAKGHNVVALIDHAIASGWRNVFEPKDGNKPAQAGNHQRRELA